ncbi:hypothetical protein [Nocardia sp. NPDC046763]|uniref:cytidine deaminase family protein n=1 Tax=Nocardia sp. NPDC046763 TaxID=3155256 RepID=UPI0033DE7FE2
MATTDDYRLLIDQAAALSVPQPLTRQVTAGYAGAALRAVDGRVYTGRSLTGNCGVAFCAEVGAVLAMLKSGTAQITALATVSNDHRLMPPCGRCREMLFQLHHENLRAVVVLDGALVTLAELLPIRWQELWDD